MNFDFTEKEQKLFKELQDIMAGLAAEGGLEEKEPVQSEILVRKALARLSKTAYLKLGTVKEDDAEGLCAMMEAMGIVSSYSPTLYLSIEMSVRLFGRIINAFGNEEQKNKWLSPVLSGKKIGAVALSERAMNIENDAMETLGVRENGIIKVTGTKSYVINGPVADFTAVAGIIKNKPAFFIAGKEAKGLVPGKPFSMMGYDGIHVSGLALDECVIDESGLLGPFEDKSVFDKIKLWENQIIIGGSLGMMKSSFETAKSYAKTHRTGGKPIIAYQEVGFKLAEMLTLLQTSQLFAYRAAWASESENRESEILTCCAKVFCSEAAERVSGSALQILSGEGYISGNAAERAYRSSKYGQIAGTSTEIARVKIGNASLGAL
jgi:alkylation response protein AidB-like acyl-CoA dehydrogenase